MEEAIRGLRLYFPDLAEAAVDYEMTPYGELIITLKDDTRYAYDDYKNSITRLATNGHELTEQEYRREFARRLRKIMLNRRMTQRDLSEAIGISEVQLSLYLNGKQTPTVYRVSRIAKALDCTLDELSCYK